MKPVVVYSPSTIHSIKNLIGRNVFFPLEGEAAVYFPKTFVLMSPFVLSMLAAWSSKCKIDDIPLKCYIDNVKNPHVLDYAWRMKLMEFMSINYDPGYKKRDPSGRFIPLTKITTSSELENFLIDMIPLLHLPSPDNANAVRYCFSELIRNVLEHAGESISAFACAQYYKKTNKISIGIADCGKGVFSSLYPAYSHILDDSTAIVEALKPGITGGKSKDNAGAGLYFVRSIAKGAGTYFTIYSGTSCYRLRQRRKIDAPTLLADPLKERYDLFKNLAPWQGTVIAVEIGLNSVPEFEQVLSDIRKTFFDKKTKEKKRRRIRFT